MIEKFIHYLWQYKLLEFNKLITTEGEKITIINVGEYNRNSGVDFLNAKLKIDEQLWYGNVEIHLKASDWYAHQHEKDPNYDAVILHIVYENDVEVFMKNNKPLPTLELKGKIARNLLENYQDLFAKELRWIPCEKQLASVDSFIINNWLDRLYFERLEGKSKLIYELLESTNYDFEAVLFQLLAKNFGLKVNSDVFLKLSKSFSFSTLRKVRFKEYSLSALLFGQAGFLNDDLDIAYHKELQKEYEFLKHKYKLMSIAKNEFQFFRMRPNNFPTIRVAQLVALYHKHDNLFSKIISNDKFEDIYELFSIGVNDFWKEHYTFYTSSKRSSKKLTKEFINLIIINTIVPLKFVYMKHKGVLEEKKIIDLMRSLRPEKNNVITKFSDLNIPVKNAFDSQALIELKYHYCDKKRCLDCAIGMNLMKENN